jgi:hypothetical protein
MTALERLNQFYTDAADPEKQKEQQYKTAADQVLLVTIRGLDQLADHLNAAVQSIVTAENPQRVLDLMEEQAPGIALEVVRGFQEIKAFLIARLPRLESRLVSMPAGTSFEIDQETGKVTFKRA